MDWTNTFLCWIIFSSTTTKGRLGTLPNTYDGVLRKTVNSFVHYYFWKPSLRKKYPHSELFWSAFFSHFPTFELYKERYCIQFECAKMRGKCGPPNTDTFYAVHLEHLTMSWMHLWSQIHYYHHGQHKEFKISLLLAYTLTFTNSYW